MRLRRRRSASSSVPLPAATDVVFDFVALDATLKLAAEVVSIGGRLTVVGLGGGTMPSMVGIAPTIPFEARLVIPFGGTRAELEEVIALA
jgi:propanol-preferring alcohol dehydrogenase